MSEALELALILTGISVLVVAAYAFGRASGQNQNAIDIESLRTATYHDGIRAGQAQCFQQVIDYAVASLRKHRDWKDLSAYDALMKAAVLIGGEEAIEQAQTAAALEERFEGARR